MLLFTLFLSFLAVYAAEDVLDRNDVDSVIEELIAKAYETCDYDMRDWKYPLKQLGIDYNRTYRVDYSYFNKLDLVQKTLTEYSELTIAEQTKLAKKENPEITQEIDQYCAYRVRNMVVYMYSVVFKGVHIGERLLRGTIQVPGVSNAEALYLIDRYNERAIHIIANIHQETSKTIEETIELFEGSKVLNLKHGYDYVQEQSENWINNCLEESQNTPTRILSENLDD